jgi:hypothetical protein
MLFPQYFIKFTPTTFNRLEYVCVCVCVCVCVWYLDHFYITLWTAVIG